VRIPQMLSKRLRAWIPQPVVNKIRLRRFASTLPSAKLPEAPAPHGLPGELIVSLTSYPPRFWTLHFTIRSLLTQTVRPDRVILWVAHADAAALPSAVKKLTRQGLEIRRVADVRSYKKLVFALTEFPESFHVTADDDIYYPSNWLKELVDAVEPGKKVLPCHRAHRVPTVAGPELPPYLSWEWDVQDEAARQPSADLLPTGVGGILYPPHALHSDVTDSALFMKLCPTADDLWFYWMARRAGAQYRKVGGPFEQTLLPGTQDESLFTENAAANDRQIRNLVERYGMPDDIERARLS
jgi:hypothetical protein